MSLWPDTAAKMLNEQHDVYEKAREEYRKKIAEQAQEIENLRKALRDAERRKLTWRKWYDNEVGISERLRNQLAEARAALGGSDD